MRMSPVAHSVIKLECMNWCLATGGDRKRMVARSEYAYSASVASRLTFNIKTWK